MPGRCPGAQGQSMDASLYAASRHGIVTARERRYLPMKAYVYTDDQINEFRLNPYTYSVSHYQLVFTLEFKQFFYKQMQKPGMTTKKIMRAAGYDPSMFTKSKLDKVRRMVLQEARSETGFRPPRGASDAEKAAAFAAKDLSLQKTEVTLKEMQGRISMLEKELELLKKNLRIRQQQQKD